MSFQGLLTQKQNFISYVNCINVEHSMFIIYLNNKRVMQGYISSMSVGVSVCVCICLSARDLRNSATYGYRICTAYWCDDTGESEVLIFYIF